MNRVFRFLILSVFVLSLPSCGNDVASNEEGGSGGGNSSANVNRNNVAANPVFGRLEFPRLKGGNNNIVLIHQASFGVNYCVEWDTDLRPTGWDWSNDGGTLRSQRWSCYQMHPGNSSNYTNRKPRETGDFAEYPNDPDFPDIDPDDPEKKSQYHFSSDPYWNSGYDHGHIFPSADRAYSYNAAANRQTFYMTNMQPQAGGFNSYVWAEMEKQVRRWNSATLRDTLYIVKGGTIDNADNIIKTIGSGKNRIPVPKYFYMAVLRYKKGTFNGGYQAMGFWIRHQSNSNTNLAPYVVNIRELERLTGIDFFCNLPDNIENAAETRSRENILRDWLLN